MRLAKKFVQCQAGLGLPTILLCVAAALLGALAFNFLSNKQTDAQTANGQQTEQSTAKNNAALAALQEQLQTSLALPVDFRTVQDFELLDTNAQTLTQDVFEDHWSLVFFGYTHCPDVCPITLQVMKEVVAKLEEQQQTPPQIVFVSVDPVRDTADIMKKYIGYFDDEFVGVTGDFNEMHKLISSLGVVASFTANESDPDNYLVDHTASLLLIDPQKRVRAKVTPPHEADKIIADYLLVTSSPS